MDLLINGAHIFCTEHGSSSGVPVIFLHGFPFSSAMWEGQVETVGKEYRAIIYDLRGHGSSEVGDGQYTIEGHVDDLLALITTLKLDRPVLVGLSMGGYIVLRALERAQERFRGAVLCDTRSEADGNEAKLKRFTVVSAIKRIGAEAFAKEFVKGIFTAETLQHKPDVVDRIKAVIAQTSPLSIAGTQLALASRTDTTAALPSLKLPVLILVGDSDQTTPPSAARSMHDAIQGSELHIVPGAAHMSNLENPAFFNERLMAFLSRIPR